MTAVAAAPTRRTTFDDLFDRPGSARGLAVTRIAIGVVVLVHLWPFLALAVDGRSWDDGFTEPWVSWWTLPHGAWVAMLLVGVGGAIALSLGWRTRLAAAVTLAVVAGNFFLSHTHFRHNRAFLILVLATLLLSESGRVLSLDARRRPAPDAITLWPLWLGRFCVATVYLASGFSKLVMPDWVAGTVLRDRVIRFRHLAEDRIPVVGDPLLDLISERWFHWFLSPAAVATELFIGLGLWFRRTRLAAVWVAFWFHVSIEAAASVEVFSIAALSALALWTTPVTRDRRLATPRPGLVRRLDWLARFEIEPADGWRLVDRDGRAWTGRAAVWRALLRLPATFPAAAVAVAVRGRAW